MGCFPFDCSHCGGGNGQCAIRRQNERQERLEGDKKNHEEQQEEPNEEEDFDGSDDEDEYHARCDGGQFCYSDKVVVEAGDHVILNCNYTSYGSATIGKTGHKVFASEFSEFFDGWGDVKLVADGFLCFDCYEDRRGPFPRNEIDPTVLDDHEYRQQHVAYVLKSKLGIPLPVVQHHIIPYLKNCVEHEDRYDCVLCSVIGRSYYTLEREEELKLAKEEVEKKSKKPRLN